MFKLSFVFAEAVEQPDFLSLSEEELALADKFVDHEGVVVIEFDTDSGSIRLLTCKERGVLSLPEKCKTKENKTPNALN